MSIKSWQLLAEETALRQLILTVKAVHKAWTFPKEGTTAKEVSHFSLDRQGEGPGRRIQCAITQWCPKHLL